MDSRDSPNMWVFRDTRTTAAGKSLLDGLRSALHLVPRASTPSREALLDALLRAGELECALADAASPDSRRCAQLTDLLADALVDPSVQPLPRANALLDALIAPPSLTISPPEGFAYYAVHPLDFAALAEAVPLQGADAAVVGIRNIGVTLSAVVAAALRRRGVRAERITVRPTGHPYDRRTRFSAGQIRWIAHRRAARSHFLVVDEGPGISGSSFLSVGDALLGAGVARRHIIFLASRSADPEMLAAPNATARWRSFRSLAAGPTAQIPADSGACLGAGVWRKSLFRDPSQWPASWAQMERLKFLSRDARRLYKFDGLGRIGNAVAERSRLLAGAGFAPRLLSHSAGFSEFPWVRGRPMNAAQISSSALERMADYCAFRVLEFPAAPPESRLEPSRLETMMRFNLTEAFGAGTALPSLATERPVIADGRMLPHEWLLTPSGTLLKADGASHGDDHFLPGLVDIAWDLAGAIVEWDMSTEAAQYLLQHYRRRSGDHPHARLGPYLLAYAVFRMAYCSMAAFALRGCPEEHRLHRAASHYRSLVQTHLDSPSIPERRPAASMPDYLRASFAPAEPESCAPTEDFSF